jgi:ribosomal protein S18 acetylase RimI-like enzyme
VITIAVLKKEPTAVAALAELLIDTVANGGNISFVHPVPPPLARSFWEDSLAAAQRGERVIFGAYDGNVLVGTTTLLYMWMPNQPHRAEIAKMMTRIQYRGQGVARALLQVAEQTAIESGRTLLTLDTAADDGGAQFYEKLGFSRAGMIPDYALKPLGGLTGTIFYYKRIGK